MVNRTLYLRGQIPDSVIPKTRGGSGETVRPEADGLHDRSRLFVLRQRIQQGVHLDQGNFHRLQEPFPHHRKFLSDIYVDVHKLSLTNR